MRNSLKAVSMYLIVAAATLVCIADAAELRQAGRLADGSTVPSDANFTWAQPPSLRAMIPRYSLKFIRAGIGGHFEGDALISETGEVIDVRVQNGIHPDFDRDIVKHVRKVKFRPAILDGAPVASLYKLEFDFTPDDSHKAR